MSYRLFLVLSALFFAACGRTFPASPSGNEPQPTPGPGDDVGRERLTAISGLALIPSSDVKHYLTTSTTALQQVPDTGSGQAILRMTLGFSLAYSRTQSLRTRITGTLKLMSAGAEGPVPAPDQPQHFPLEFTGHVASGGLYLDSLAGSPVGTVVDCQAVGLNLTTAIQRTVVVAPLLLSTGTTWTDSSTVPACSGSIPLTLTVVRTYLVAGQTMKGLHPVIAVDRRDRIQAVGEGAQGQHRISLVSHGSGSARLYLDGTSGLLHDSESTQTVDLVIGSSGRSQRFRQIVEEKTRLQQ